MWRERASRWQLNSWNRARAATAQPRATETSCPLPLDDPERLIRFASAVVKAYLNKPYHPPNIAPRGPTVAKALPALSRRSNVGVQIQIISIWRRIPKRGPTSGSESSALHLPSLTPFTSTEATNLPSRPSSSPTLDSKYYSTSSRQHGRGTIPSSDGTASLLASRSSIPTLLLFQMSFVQNQLD